MAAAFPRRYVTIVHGLVSVQLLHKPHPLPLGSRISWSATRIRSSWAPAEPETTPGFQVQPGLTCWNPACPHLKRNTQTQLPSYCLHTLLSIVYNIHCIDTKFKKKRKRKELRSEPNNGVGVDRLDTVFRAYCLSTCQTHRICANTVNTGQRRSWEVRKLG